MIVIFDVDGVLIDVSKSYHLSIKDTVDFFTKRDVPLEQLRDIKFSFGINNDWDVSVAGILYANSQLTLEQFKEDFKKYASTLEQMYQYAKENNLNLPKYKELVDYFENSYRKHRLKEEMIFPHEALERIREKADITGVITGRPYEDLDFSFRHFDLYKYFDLVITEDDIPKPHLRKPSAYPLKLFFEKFQYTEPVFYIGDTISDKQMVENFNKEEQKNVQFILNQNEHNKDIDTKIIIKEPDDLCDVLNSYNYSL
ncbi:MAG: HAD-IA family hydrolase [Aquificae bacterium]|nr:HAD-IA family hydrolase [Aquificota bacterium]